MNPFRRIHAKIAANSNFGMKIIGAKRRGGVAKKLKRTLRKVAKFNLLKFLRKQMCIEKPENYSSTVLKHDEMIWMRKCKVIEELNLGKRQRKTSTDLNQNAFGSTSPSKTICIEISTDDSSDSTTEKKSVKKQLMDFATKHLPPKDMFRDLLQIMKDNGVKISRTPDNLFETDFEILKFPFGSYLNIGVERSIKNYYKPNFIRKPVSLVTSPHKTENFVNQHSSGILLLDIAIYLVTPKQTKSTTTQCLTIMGRINCEVFDDPFVIGLYCGKIPTQNTINEVLKTFVDEMKHFETNHLILDDEFSFKVKINAFICDPLSHSLVTSTALPNTPFGCKKCKQKGVVNSESSIVAYPKHGNLSSERYDEDFDFLIDREHHIGASVLKDLKVGLVTQFALDYKLIICNGVMKSLMNLWKNGELEYRLNSKVQKKINCDLAAMAQFCPRELSQRQLSLENVTNWSASDWKEFLLYYSPIVLKSRMKQNNYVHFLYFHLAMRILISTEPAQFDTQSYMFGLLINTFFVDFKILYSNEKIDYNMHSLLHFEENLRMLKSFKKLNGFVYEEQISMIEEAIGDSLDELNLDETGERIIENSRTMTENKINEVIYTTYPHVNVKGELVFKNFTLSKHEPDNHVIMVDGVIRIEGIENDIARNQIFIVGRRYQKVEIMFQAPMSDQRLLLVSSLSPLYTFYLKDVISKAVKIEHHKDGIFISSLIT